MGDIALKGCAEGRGPAEEPWGAAAGKAALKALRAALVEAAEKEGVDGEARGECRAEGASSGRRRQQFRCCRDRGEGEHRARGLRRATWEAWQSDSRAQMYFYPQR